MAFGSEAFGFASVLTDMGLPQGDRLISLLGFNLGIEPGQLAIVVAVMPVIHGLRSGTFYRRALMQGFGRNRYAGARRARATGTFAHGLSE
jgi:hypothetical protein